MAPERFLTFSVASVVEDVLQQHGARLSDRDLASRKAEEAGLRGGVVFLFSLLCELGWCGEEKR